MKKTVIPSEAEEPIKTAIRRNSTIQNSTFIIHHHFREIRVICGQKMTNKPNFETKKMAVSYSL